LAQGLPHKQKLPDDSVQTTQPETHVGHYRLLELIGKGGMGVVFRAEDTRLDRPVAIKFLPSLLRDDRELFSRFQREARALSRTSHPHLCVIHDVGESERGPYLVMEYLDGQTLSDRLKSGAVSIAHMLELSIQLTRGIQAAHAAGVIHRDLKPANIILRQDGMAKIVDFGLVKFHVPTDPIGETQEFAVTKQTLATQHDQLVGTVPYMSPEQASGQDVDVRSDLFSLGIVFYEMLTGQRPFHGSTTILTIHAILTGEFTPTHEVNPDVPRSLSDTISRLLSRDPDARYPNAETLLDALHEAHSEWMTDSAVQTSSRDASVSAAPQQRGPVFTVVASLTAMAVVALLIIAWSVFSRTQPDMGAADLSKRGDNRQQEDPVIPAGPANDVDRDQHKDPDSGELSYPDVVRGLVIEPDPYRDDHNPERADPQAAAFLDDLRSHLARKLESRVPVISVTAQQWQQSIDTVNAKRDASDIRSIGENLPVLGANMLLAVWGKFLPDQKLYVFHLRLFNARGHAFFRRGFVFKEQELLENPDVCRDAITSTHIFYPKQPEAVPIDSARVSGVVIEPIFHDCNDPERFRVVTDSMRQKLQQQLVERWNRDFSIVSTTSKKWQSSRNRHPTWLGLLGEYDANFVLSIAGKFDRSSQSYVVSIHVTQDTGKVEFSRRLVYAPDEFATDLEAIWMKILETQIFQDLQHAPGGGM